MVSDKFIKDVFGRFVSRLARRLDLTSTTDVENKLALRTLLTRDRVGISVTFGLHKEPGLSVDFFEYFQDIELGSGQEALVVQLVDLTECPRWDWHFGRSEVEEYFGEFQDLLSRVCPSLDASFLKGKPSMHVPFF